MSDKLLKQFLGAAQEAGVTHLGDQADRLADQLDELLLAVHTYENSFVKNGSSPELLDDLFAKRKEFLAALAKQQASPDALPAVWINPLALASLKGDIDGAVYLHTDATKEPTDVPLYATPPSAPQCGQAAGAALGELVALKDLKARIEQYAQEKQKSPSLLQMELDYTTRKPLAWAAARAALAYQQVREQAALPAAWANKRVSPLSYVPFRSMEEAESSVNNSRIVATQEGPYELVAPYERDVAQGTTPAAGVTADTDATYESTPRPIMSRRVAGVGEQATGGWRPTENADCGLDGNRCSTYIGCTAFGCKRATKPAQAEPMSGALWKALERMDRARGWLTGGAPYAACNWAVLDTSDLRAILAEAGIEEKT